MKTNYLLAACLCMTLAGQAQTISSKREIMERFLNGTLEKNYAPAAFFMHFGKDAKTGEAAVNSHINYFVATGMDIVKIQFEQGYGRIRIEKPEDWEQIKPLPRNFFAPTLEVIDRIVNIAGHDAMILPTIYSPFQMLVQTVGAANLMKYAKEKPEQVTRAMEIFTTALIQFAKDCKARGVDGFYTPSQGGEEKFYIVPRFFERFVKPYDLQVMKEYNQDTRCNILHICDYEGNYDDLSRFADYPGQIVNTPNIVNGKPFTLKDGERLFKRIVMGGLDRKKTIHNGTPEEVKAAVLKIKKNYKGRLIIGAECTIKPDTPMENIRTAIRTAHGK